MAAMMAVFFCIPRLSAASACAASYKQAADRYAALLADIPGLAVPAVARTGVYSDDPGSASGLPSAAMAEPFKNWWSLRLS